MADGAALEMRNTTPHETLVTVNKGTCYAIFAYDIGTSIALDEADRRITAGTGGADRRQSPRRIRGHVGSGGRSMTARTCMASQAEALAWAASVATARAAENVTIRISRTRTGWRATVTAGAEE